MKSPVVAACLMVVGGLLGGCGSTIYNVKIPLTANPEAVVEDASHVVIEDTRDRKSRETHTGGGLFSCQRWYGDDTFQPPKLVALDKLIAARVPAGTPVRIRLDRFDTIEYCENTANRAGAAAAAGASGATGMPIYMPASTVPGGDSLHLRLAGEINGVPFEVSRAFDYDGLKRKFSEMPSANATYRELLQKAMGELADEIVARLPKSNQAGG